MTGYWFTVPVFMGFVGCTIMALAGGDRRTESNSSSSPLTVGEVINIGNTLANIDTRPTGQLDPRGNPLVMAADFKFSGPTRLAFAHIVSLSRTVLKEYQDAVAALERQAHIAGGGSGGPPTYKSSNGTDGTGNSTGGNGGPAPGTSDPNMLAVEREKMFNAPASVTLPHIKEADLCLEGPPSQPACAVKNELPISVLSVLVPILILDK